jgi:hypothetical protein
MTRTSPFNPALYIQINPKTQNPLVTWTHLPWSSILAEMLRKGSSFNARVVQESRGIADLIDSVVGTASDVVTSIVMSIAEVSSNTKGNMTVSTVRAINEDGTANLDTT